MKSKIDVVKGWLRKAKSDTLAMNASLQVGALDAACFHAQQASEKNLKAFLTYAGSRFPFTHNLVKLTELCSSVDSSFRSLTHVVELLTPYAVELRYDDEFWPTVDIAQEARAAALTVEGFIVSKLPSEVKE